MLNALLCYNDEATVFSRTEEEDLGDGKTEYRAVARHGTEETQKQHEQMG